MNILCMFDKHLHRRSHFVENLEAVLNNTCHTLSHWYTHEKIK